MYHRIRVFDADAVRSAMVFHNVHYSVISTFVRPVALPLEHHRKCSDRFRTGLNDALHRIVVRELSHVAAAIFDDVNLVSIVDGLNGRQCNTRFRPQPCQHDFLASAALDSVDEVCIVQGIHARALDWLLPRKDRLNLRPHVAAECLGFDRGQDDWHVKYARRFGKGKIVIDDRLAVKVGDAEKHLRLKVDNCDDTVIGREQSFFLSLGREVLLGMMISL